jgi:hypothetical protein
MQIVAVTRWNPDRKLEQELPRLANGLGLGLYDARIKLAAPLPIVVGSALSPQAARERLELFRSLGHGAVACEVETILAPESMLLARGFELGDAALAIDAAKGRITVDYPQILGIVRAFELSSETQTLQIKEDKLALGRALLTGGLMTKKSVTREEVHASTERQRTAYLFHAAAGAPVLLKEHSLRYDGLGPLRGVSTHQSFQSLMACLRERTPGALHDERLLTHRRHADLSAVRGVSADRAISTSNAGSNALAAQVLLLAHAQGQL